MTITAAGCLGDRIQSGEITDDRAEVNIHAGLDELRADANNWFLLSSLLLISRNAFSLWAGHMLVLR